MIRLVNNQQIQQRMRKQEIIIKRKRKTNQIKSNKLKDLQCFKLNFIIKNTRIQKKQTAFIQCKFQQQKTKKKYQIVNNQKLERKLSQNSQKIQFLQNQSTNNDDNFFNKNYLFKQIENQMYKKYQKQQKQFFQLIIPQINMENLMRQKRRAQKLFLLININLKDVNKKINNYFFQFVIFFNLLYHLFIF
ncbi:transmembrane protein, putative (macronuclear) [Tetrahymena thermophila SB210]|uniref:Transmembrane protein, putative n=1 Tax=Tetrahymena thermophila (strain SB210) TaxID=312017 RepID=W7XEC9_TETTS|nr:transmembrane protein, putative [Tetrahymena thermophila SB210]EWS71239.1 transmembrane protein, putative [Tetrahymena thermophila SB210]|eukprot:XP_012656227.1 transmembrane protein, putative [Tetrahymena thermophila SB210]